MPNQHIINPAFNLTPPHIPEPLTRFLALVRRRCRSIAADTCPASSGTGVPDAVVSGDEDERVLLVPFGEVVGVVVGDAGEGGVCGVKEEEDGGDALEE